MRQSIWTNFDLGSERERRWSNDPYLGESRWYESPSEKNYVVDFILKGFWVRRKPAKFTHWVPVPEGVERNECNEMSEMK